MEIRKTPFEGLLVLQPRVLEDPRGYFFESYHRQRLAESGMEEDFVQDNQSGSANKGTLRGLHLQKPPHAQAKLVSVLKGAALDVAVDVRKDSPTFGQHFTCELNERNRTILYIPEGFAHGFVTLEDHTVFSYKCSRYYHRGSEVSLRWNDPDLGIHWGVTSVILSPKDESGVPWQQFTSPF